MMQEKARHDEGLERLAGVHYVHAVHFGNDADAQRRGELGARFRAIEYRSWFVGFLLVVMRLSRCVFQEPGLPQERKPARFDGFEGIELPL